VAKEQQRQFDSARARGEQSMLPTKTPLAQAVASYAAHMKAARTVHGYTADLSYLRNAFGPICDVLRPKRRRNGTPQENVDMRRRESTIQAVYLEHITVAQVSSFVRDRVQRYGLQAKTANRYREVLRRLFSWSMEEGGVRMPGNINPAGKMKRYKERAPEIRFLTLKQIGQQLKALQDHPVIHAMAATYIYAGLRREEALWLTRDDVDFAVGGRGVIRVRAKTVEGHSWEPKTKVNRIVPISRALRTILDAYVGPVASGPWFFPSPRGKRWNSDNFSRALAELNRAADLPWTCLTYRHTFGSQLAMKGESLYKISTLLGNSPEICRKHYAALMPESLTQSVEFDDDCSDRES
jgi:integrase